MTEVGYCSEHKLPFATVLGCPACEQEFEEWANTRAAPAFDYDDDVGDWRVARRTA